MADDEKKGEIMPTGAIGGDEKEVPARGVDWEVVSLTASAYAAAPDIEGFNPNDDDGSRQESSSALFLSGHFVFPPSEHENLPIESYHTHDVSKGKTITPAEEEGTKNVEDRLDDDVSQGTEFFDDENTFSARGVEFEEGKGLQRLDSISYAESTEPASPGDSPNQDLNQDLSSPQKDEKSSEGDIDDESGHPCAAWWKKHVTSLYCHVKEANTFWSIIVAAALTGLVVLGKRWHQDKWHAQELKQHLTINDEKMKGAMGPIGRLKNIILGGR